MCLCVCVCVWKWERKRGRETGVKWVVYTGGWPSALSRPVQPCSTRLGPGSCSTVVTLSHTHTHTQGHMNTQIDLQRVPQSQQPEREWERLWACTSIHTFTHTQYTHTHTQQQQLPLFATAAVDSDNMCFVPYVCVSVCMHTQTHSGCLSALVFQVSILSVQLLFFFPI